ncbi:MAG: lysophospholipid acyltransferase family protein [Bryobacteraceae bacterium]
MAQRKRKLQTWAEYAVARALTGALELLPLPAARLLSSGAARLMDLAIPKLRRVAMANLSFAFPELRDESRNEIIDGVFQSIARLLLAISRFPRLNASNVRTWIDYDGLSNYLDAKKHGRGVLVATAHLGNWELSAFAHALMTEPMHIMVRPLDNVLIDALVESRRAFSGNTLIEKKDGARLVIKALRANAAVGILIDQNTTATEGVWIDFFGKPACASSAFVKLAHHTGAVVVPGFALWDENLGRYVLRFYPEIEMTGDVQTDTQTIHRIFERVIRKHPEQWLWIHRRWKTRPPGEPPLY